MELLPGGGAAVTSPSTDTPISDSLLRYAKKGRVFGVRVRFPELELAHACLAPSRFRDLYSRSCRGRRLGCTTDRAIRSALADRIECVASIPPTGIATGKSIWLQEGRSCGTKRRKKATLLIFLLFGNLLPEFP
jgi:hypothetical protein